MPRQRSSTMKKTANPSTGEPRTVFGSQKKDESALAKLVDPVRFVNDYLNHRIWAGQSDILGAVATHPRVAVKACHASSKTFTAAELVL
jgi:hypothetical protein